MATEASVSDKVTYAVLLILAVDVLYIEYIKYKLVNIPAVSTAPPDAKYRSYISAGFSLTTITQ